MNSTNTVSIVLLSLVGGFILGYLASAVQKQEASGYISQIGMHGAMGSMMMGLQGRTGADLERAFLDEMIVHHQGAIEMAQTLLAGTNRPELIKLGNDIITAQTGEIEMMKRWRTEWFGQ